MSDGSLTATERAAGAKLVNDYAAEFWKAEAASSAAHGAFDYIQVHCPIALRVTITAPTELAPERTFRLYSLVSDFSSDSFSAELDAGYFKSISATGEDATADVLVGTVKTAATLAWSPTGIPGAAA